MTKHLYQQRLNNGNDLFLSPYTRKEGCFEGNRYCIDAQEKGDKPMCLSAI
jgi:hypothetical protein